MSETNGCYYYDEQHNRCKCYVNENLDELLQENARLRELVRDALMPRLLYGIYRCPDEDMVLGDVVEWANSELHDRARKLGIKLEMDVSE